jgi:hypothetical protein
VNLKNELALFRMAKFGLSLTWKKCKNDSNLSYASLAQKACCHSGLGGFHPRSQLHGNGNYQLECTGTDGF